MWTSTSTSRSSVVSRIHAPCARCRSGWRADQGSPLRHAVVGGHPNRAVTSSGSTSSPTTVSLTVALVTVAMVVTSC